MLVEFDETGDDAEQITVNWHACYYCWLVSQLVIWKCLLSVACVEGKILGFKRDQEHVGGGEVGE